MKRAKILEALAGQVAMRESELFKVDVNVHFHSTVDEKTRVAFITELSEQLGLQTHGNALVSENRLWINVKLEGEGVEITTYF
jgi:hypothetical protein